MSNKKWTDTQLQVAVKESRFLTDVLRKLGLSPTSGNFNTVKKYIAKLGLDYSHFCSRGNWIGKGGIPKKSLEEILVLKPGVCLRSNMKKRLFKEGVLKEQCGECGIEKVWNNKPLVLQIDHKNGNKYDNRLDNLRVLCPNCHSQTENFGSKNNRYNEHHGFQRIAIAKPKKEKVRKINTTKDELTKLVENTPIVQVAKSFGVSDNAIRRLCKIWNIPLKGQGFWGFSNRK